MTAHLSNNSWADIENENHLSLFVLKMISIVGGSLGFYNTKGSTDRIQDYCALEILIGTFILEHGYEGVTDSTARDCAMVATSCIAVMVKNSELDYEAFNFNSPKHRENVSRISSAIFNLTEQAIDHCRVQSFFTTSIAA